MAVATRGTTCPGGPSFHKHEATYLNTTQEPIGKRADLFLPAQHVLESMDCFKLLFLRLPISYLAIATSIAPEHKGPN